MSCHMFDVISIFVIFYRIIGAIIDEIIGSVFPDFDGELDPSLMSFEGLWEDLVTMANLGVNTGVNNNLKTMKLRHSILYIYLFCFAKRECWLETHRTTAAVLRFNTEVLTTSTGQNSTHLNVLFLLRFLFWWR